MQVCKSVQMCKMCKCAKMCPIWMHFVQDKILSTPPNPKTIPLHTSLLGHPFPYHLTNSVSARLTDLLFIRSKSLSASCSDHLYHHLPDIHGVHCCKHPMWVVAFSIWTKERTEVTYEGRACFYWVPWPHFSEFPYENQWVSGSGKYHQP